MREVGPQECALVRAVLERHRERLMALGGVHRVDIGFKSVGGQLTDELAIRVHVAAKVPLQRLAAADVPPEEIERIPLDVLASVPEGQAGGRTPIDCWDAQAVSPRRPRSPVG
jgi:hypothetical protein